MEQEELIIKTFKTEEEAKRWYFWTFMKDPKWFQNYTIEGKFFREIILKRRIKNEIVE